jgi:hypothetical protein
MPNSVHLGTQLHCLRQELLSSHIQMHSGTALDHRFCPCLITRHLYCLERNNTRAAAINSPNCHSTTQGRLQNTIQSSILNLLASMLRNHQLPSGPQSTDLLQPLPTAPAKVTEPSSALQSRVTPSDTNFLPSFQSSCVSSQPKPPNTAYWPSHHSSTTNHPSNPSMLHLASCSCSKPQLPSCSNRPHPTLHHPSSAPTAAHPRTHTAALLLRADKG